MELRRVGFVAVAALVAAPVQAEKAYIPVVDGAAQRTEVSLTNAQGARAATVLARIGYEAGGVSAQQQVTLGGGQSLRLSGLAGNGLVELDLAKGVSATATLVVTRPGGKTVRASLPVLTQVDHMPAGSNASLKIVDLPEEYRKVAVGAVNLSSRATRCEARFHDFDGKQLAAPIGFTVAPFSERRAGSFAGAKGRYDIDTLNTLRCDQPFWTYAVAEHPKSGDVKIVYPMKEVVLNATPSVTTEASTIYQIGGQFFVAKSGQWSYKYTMYFGTRKTWRQTFVDYDVYHNGWDPVKPGGIHLLSWLQYEGWSQMLQYFNALSKHNRFRWNYTPSAVAPNKAPVLKKGNTYHAHTYWDGVLHRNGYLVSLNGVPYVGNYAFMGGSSWSYTKLFISFAHPKNGPHGPEARSPGWRWSNLKIELVP